MAIDLFDYSRSAAAKGWGAGWPADRRGDMATVTADRSGTKIPVHWRIARLVDLLVDAVEAGGYLLVPGWCWGYANRAISGTKTASNHSWGLGVDINAPNNPYSSSGNHDIPRWVGDLFARYGFAWGANYTGSKKDWMHFEFMGSPTDADVMTALAVLEIGADMSPQELAVLLDRTKQTVDVLDGYYAAYAAKYGIEAANKHDFGRALFDIEQVLGGWYAEAVKTHGVEWADQNPLGAGLFHLYDKLTTGA